MKNLIAREYNCKDEELPVLSGFALFCLKRDRANFLDYSHKYNEAFIAAFEDEIGVVTDLVAPHSEVTQQKLITERLNFNMHALLNLNNRLGGYIDMGYDIHKMTTADFGLSALRAAVNRRDVENVLKCLHEVNGNITKYNEALTAQGLKPELTEGFTDAYTSIAADKQTQYEISSNRKNIIQANIGTLNGLYATLSEVLSTGKILYHETDPVKEKEYTFSHLMKSVRRASKPDDETKGEAPTSDSTPEA